jgi:tetratricopeptide (TPR) repeat protein
VLTEIDRWLAEGVALVEHRDYALALVPLNRVTREASIGPTSSDAWRLKSRALVSLGHLEQALVAADHAAQDQPDDLRALKQRAKVYELLKRYPEASADYERVLELSPDDLNLWLLLGNARLCGGNAAEGLRAYERALAINETSVAAWYDKGLALERLQRPAEALAAYLRATQVTPGDTYVYAMSCNNAAMLLLQTNRLTEALALVEQAQQSTVALVSDRARAWGISGDIFLKQQRFAEALAQFEQALALAPANADHWHGKGNALYKLGQPDQLDAAIAAYDEALRLDPTRAAVRQDRLYALAHRLLTQSTSLGLSDPNAPPFAEIDDWNIWQAEASYFAGWRRLSELEAALNQMLRTDPHYLSALSSRLVKVLVQARQKHYREAWMTFQQVVRIPRRQSQRS